MVQLFFPGQDHSCHTHILWGRKGNLWWSWSANQLAQPGRMIPKGPKQWNSAGGVKKTSWRFYWLRNRNIWQRMWSNQINQMALFCRLNSLGLILQPNTSDMCTHTHIHTHRYTLPCQQARFFVCAAHTVKCILYSPSWAKRGSAKINCVPPQQKTMVHLDAR